MSIILFTTNQTTIKMKIQKIKIEDFKKVKNLESVIDGKNVIITGENGVGKSTVMQFIEIALGRTDNIPPQATGEGMVVMSRDGKEYTFHVKFKDGKPQLTITTPDGLRDSRKGVIANITGAVEFDINKFVDQSKTEAGRKQQVEYFKSLLPDEVREYIAKLEANCQKHYEDRTEINREIKSLKGKIELHPMHKPGSPSSDEIKYIDTEELMVKFNEQSKINSQIHGVQLRQEERNRELDRLKAEKENKEQVIADMLEKIKQLESEVKANLQLQSEVISKVAEANAWLDVNKEVNVSQISEEISAANKNNEAFRLVQDYEKDFKMLNELTEDSGHKTALIESERQLIADTIRDMANDSPVPGLQFDSDRLYYNGFAVDPDVLSFSEIAELGVKMRIAENPNLPLFISNGESIGNERFELIKRLARDNDMQIIMEEMIRGQEELVIEVMTDDDIPEPVKPTNKPAKPVKP